ncbi:shikimate dehydrogenase [Pelagibacteraceae bacterium]|nr:shikimate dehydrogenase [Pelagibacteraceae bacterium]
MKKFYVVGNKTSKSLSPVIFNYWFEKYKINAKYKYLETNKKNFEKTIKSVLNDKDVAGLNITIPFKQKIIQFVDTLNKHSKEINAINCISIGSKIKGINTDWVGYYKSMPKNHNLKNKKIILIGYGGAALAIHYLFINKGFKKILIFNRTKKKLSFLKKTKYTMGLGLLNRHLSTSDLIINTTPRNPISKKNVKLIRKDTLLSDIVYNPKETSFLKKFPNNKKIYGISMLLEQAVPCFKKWFGFNPSIDKILIQKLDSKIR